MTNAQARRAFSIIVDVAGSKDALMDHLRTRHGSDTATIWGAEEGDLHLIDIGLRDHPAYELEWETGTMPRHRSRRTRSGVIETLVVQGDDGPDRREDLWRPDCGPLSPGIRNRTLVILLGLLPKARSGSIAQTKPP